MSFLTSDVPACELLVADARLASSSVPSARERPTPSPAANPLERLAQLLLANDRLMDELASSRERVARAGAYRDEPECNLRFGAAHFERCRARHSGILAQLRANRIEALGILGRGGSAL